MTSNTITLLRLAFITFVLSIGLGACSSGSSEPNTNPPPTAPTPEPEPEPEPDPADGIPPGGVSIITPTPATHFNFWGGDNNGPVGSAETISVDHTEFSEAVRVTVTNPAGAFWNGQVQFPTTSNASAGDTILVRIFFRSISTLDETGAGFTTVFLEGPGPAYTKHIERELTSTGEWQEYFIPGQLANNENAGELALKIGIGAGSRPQVFDIGGIAVINYGTSKTPEQLPQTQLTYVGREADAEWRIAAAERIEQHRKGDFSVQVVDLTSSPLANVDIEVNFKKHAYHFGSVTVGNIITGTGSNSEKYREVVLEMFNQSGPENDLKWSPWLGEWNTNFSPEITLAALEWLKEHGFYLRGHVMVWPGRGNLPNFLQPQLPDNPADVDESVKQIVLDHIDDIASRTAHVLDEWDVLNEPYDNHYLMDAFGDEVMVDWFNRARFNLAEQKLYINDYSILSAGGRDAAHQQHYEDTIQYLLDNNAPLDGIGMQGHFSSSPTAIPRIYEIVERFHQKFPDLDIRTTEFDVDTLDEQLQADYTRDFITMFFSHPATVGVQKWGFWAGAHWRPSAAMYTLDWQEKPNAVAWRELIFNTWWNDFAGTTDSDGEFSARGFYGTYEVIINHNNTEVRCEFELTRESSAFIVPTDNSLLTDGICQQ